LTVYSTRFISGTSTPSTGLSYTVPGGYVAVIRDVAMLPIASGLTAAAVGVSGGAFFWKVVTGTNGVSQQWQGRQVLNAGETLIADVAGASAEYMISGYLLAL
jgi:hypothetical protein